MFFIEQSHLLSNNIDIISIFELIAAQSVWKIKYISYQVIILRKGVLPSQFL